MTLKEERFFKQTIWYHGTTLAEWKSICKYRVLADFNIGYSLDYGNGFYLSPSETDTQKYAMDTIKYNGSELLDEKTPVVLAFEYDPYQDIITGISYKYFAKYDDAFAEFVFQCRNNFLYPKTHPYDITGGVMTDTVPTKIMQQYFANQISKEQVLKSFKKSTSKKQLCLHTQYLCDRLKLVRAYIVNGKELDINEYTRQNIS